VQPEDVTTNILLFFCYRLRVNAETFINRMARMSNKRVFLVIISVITESKLMALSLNFLLNIYCDS
jgi:hypothetical protein